MDSQLAAKPEKHTIHLRSPIKFRDQDGVLFIGIYMNGSE